jgi:hypothetical protein
VEISYFLHIFVRGGGCPKRQSDIFLAISVVRWSHPARPAFYFPRRYDFSCNYLRLDYLIRHVLAGPGRRRIEERQAKRFGGKRSFLLPADGGGIFLDKARKRVLR